MAYTLANLQDDIRDYTEVDSAVLSNSVLNTMIKNVKTKYTEKQILTTTDFMQHQTYKLVTDMSLFHLI